VCWMFGVYTASSTWLAGCWEDRGPWLLRRRRPRPGDKWYMDEIFVKINGVGHYLWRAVDQDGVVLDVLVQRHRDAVAAKKFFRKLLKGLRYVPQVIVTDKLGSYQAAHRAMAASAKHRRSKYLNNRAENSHQPTRVREQTMKCFHSAGQAQRFCSAHGVISSHFRPGRHLMSGTKWPTEMSHRHRHRILNGTGSDHPSPSPYVAQTHRTSPS
jgi:putative transposase